MSAESKSAFISRFDAIWAQARRVQLSQALCWAVLTALAGVALLAAADYWLELPLPLRLAAVVAITVGAVAVATSLAMQSVRRWKRQATAAAIEQVFPQLGQRIRTTVQYGELSEGQDCRGRRRHVARHRLGGRHDRAGQPAAARCRRAMEEPGRGVAAGGGGRARSWRGCRHSTGNGEPRPSGRFSPTIRTRRFASSRAI